MAILAAVAFIAASGARAQEEGGLSAIAPTVAAPAAVAVELPEAAPPAQRDPARGAVTNLPLPRFVTLKTGEGNARRGPSLTHRVDWVFTRAGMPLKVTAEHENWRRVEDAEGAGGWVHYALLSGTRSVLVTEDMAEFRSAPQESAPVVMQAEAGVVARLLECGPDWCRVSTEGMRGWVHKHSIWGVEAGEIVD